MEIKSFVEQGNVPVTVMHLDGNLDSSTYEAFQAEADKLIEQGAQHILVDLSHTIFISSAGFRAFNAIFTRLRTKNEDQVKKEVREGTYKSRHFKLLNLSDEAKTAFEMAGFDMYIETFNDMKTAVASFG